MTKGDELCAAHTATQRSATLQADMPDKEERMRQVKYSPAAWPAPSSKKAWPKQEGVAHEWTRRNIITKPDGMRN